MSEFLTTKEVADLLRIKERKVYDLASSGAIPHNKAIGKLLFPRQQINAWLEQHAQYGNEPLDQRPPVVHGSHDLLLEWALRESQSNLATLFDGSSDGLHRFVDREGVLSGLHIYDADDDSWNINAAQAVCHHLPVVLVNWSYRQRGLIMPSELKSNIKTLSDITNYRVVMRQPAAGSQLLFEQLLEKEGVQVSQLKTSDIARSENDLAASIKLQQADVGFGLAHVAAENGLHFLPVLEEQFDLLIDRRAYFDEPIQRLFDFAKTKRFKERVESMVGYNVDSLGRVIVNF